MKELLAFLLGTSPEPRSLAAQRELFSQVLGQVEAKIKLEGLMPW